MIDRYAIVAIAAFVYVVIVSPLVTFVTDGYGTDRPENKVVWPALAMIAVVLAVRNWSRLTLPPHIVCLFAYLAFAGASILWAFKPEYSLIRFILQVTIVISIVLPGMLAVLTTDMMRGVFLCFAIALILNVFVVFNQTPIHFGYEVGGAPRLGYPGYFSFKGVLGECAAIALMLSFHEMFYPGIRRVLGIIVIAIAVYLMILSQSKGSLGLAVIAPFLAGLTLIIGKKMRVSPAIVLLPIPICYAALSSVNGNLLNRMSYALYGNYNLSGRTEIWDFVNFEIARRPLLGWGYQSFWLVGPDSPARVEAPGWIKSMPSAHNGYLDTILDTGYVGLALFGIFIIATLHAIGRVASHDPARAWLILSLALFIILTNLLETVWLRGMDLLWVVFVILSAEIGRYWQLYPPMRPACGSSPPTPVSRSFSRRARMIDFGRNIRRAP